MVNNKIYQQENPFIPLVPNPGILNTSFILTHLSGRNQIIVTGSITLGLCML